LCSHSLPRAAICSTCPSTSASSGQTFSRTAPAAAAGGSAAGATRPAAHSAPSQCSFCAPHLPQSSHRAALCVCARVRRSFRISIDQVFVLSREAIPQTANSLLHQRPKRCPHGDKSSVGVSRPSPRAATTCAIATVSASTRALPQVPAAGSVHAAAVGC
jgi:hypothetical protein